MAEYINKQALITEIQSAVSMVLQTAPYEKVWFDRFVDRQNEIMAIIERQPAAEVEPVRHGRWIPEESGDVYFTCSYCDHVICTNWDYDDLEWNFCPECGCAMDGGADNG